MKTTIKRTRRAGLRQRSPVVADVATDGQTRGKVRRAEAKTLSLRISKQQAKRVQGIIRWEDESARADFIIAGSGRPSVDAD